MTGIEIIKKLHENNFEAYIVGGYVRDMIIGKENKDMDIVTSAYPEMIYKLFREHAKVYMVGRSFGVTLVDGIEVATFRKDKYFGLDDKNVNITFANTLEEDLERRDLTINALALDINTCRIIDYHNGLEDIQNKVIRFIGKPIDRINEDPNRIVRACRFLAKIDGVFEDNTKRALKRHCKYVKKYVAPERLRLEILKSMTIENASKFFISLYDINCLRYIFPYLHNCYGHDHGKFHSEDVFTHQMLCGDYMSTNNKLLKLAGYLHDVGKPLTYKLNEKTNSYHFREHEKVGAEILKNHLIRDLKFSGYEGEYISDAVKFHMRISTGKIGPKTTRKILRDLESSKTNYKELLKIKIADRRSNLSRKPFTISEIKKMLKSFKDEINKGENENSFLKLELDGNEIMELTGLNPGPKVKEIIKFLSEQVIDNPELNNKDNLKAMVINYER